MSLDIEQMYENSPESVRNLFYCQDIEITSNLLGKRTICINGKNYKNVDGLAKKILEKENKTQDDKKISQKLSSLYEEFKDKTFIPIGRHKADKISIRLRELDPFSETESEKTRSTESAATSPMEDFIYFLELGKTKILQASYGEQAKTDCIEISNRSKQKTKIPIHLPNRKIINEEPLKVRTEFTEDVRKRGLRTQFMGIVERYDSLSPDIQKITPLDLLRSHIENISNAETNEQREPSYAFLSKVFLMDLLEKLGPDREQFIDDILIFLEQAYDTHLIGLLTEQLDDTPQISEISSSPSSREVTRNQNTPKIKNSKRQIIIPENPEQPVLLKLTLDCSKQYIKNKPDDIDNLDELPHGIRLTLSIGLDLDPAKRTFSVKAERLKNAPTEKQSSTLYPIIYKKTQNPQPEIPIK